MKQKTLRLLTVFILGLSIISGCVKDDDMSDDDSTTDYVPAKGFAESNEEPEGSALVLPEGLSFEGIEPYDILDETDCNGQPRVGAPAEGCVPLCLLFRNTSQHPVTLQLRPGLIFISKEIKIQNGILIQKVSKEIPAKQYLYVPIRAQCINPGRFFPGVGDAFRMGPVTQNGPMLDLIKKLATKNLTVTGDINIDADVAAKIQSLVFSVARKGKMDDFDKSVFDQLPNL